jgi:integrase
VSGRRRFGSIRTLPSGRYQARYLDATERQHSATFASAKEAKRWLAAEEVDRQRGAWVDPRSGRITLDAYAGAWLARRSDLRPTTQAKYAHLLGRHIAPALGREPLGRLTSSVVRAWYLALRAQHPTTADDAYRLLRAVFNTAVADEVLAVSPCRVKGAGQVHSAERPVASMAELAAAVAATPERYRAALLLVAWCQLRRGEVLGLQRGDVDLMHNRVHIVRAWSAPMGRPPLVGPPKTAAGVRWLAMPANVVPSVADHLARFVGPAPSDWLFAVAGGPVNPRTLDRVWDGARRAIGRPDLHLHDLRHSGLTWAATTGATVAELMRRGGHANPAAALRYQHATEDRDAAMAAALAALAASAPVVELRPDDAGGNPSRLVPGTPGPDRTTAKGLQAV